MRTKYWIFLLGLVCIGCVAAIVVLFGHSRTGTTARVLQNGVELHRLSLDEDVQLTVTAPGGSSNTIAVRDGRICVLQATCPDQVCVDRGWVSDTAAPIVCLPHGLVIEVEGSDLQVDAET